MFWIVTAVIAVAVTGALAYAGLVNAFVPVAIGLTTAGCPLRGQIQKDVRDRIGSLPGLQSMEVSPLLKHVKQAGTLLSGDRLAGQLADQLLP